VLALEMASACGLVLIEHRATAVLEGAVQTRA
jgi:hypothetical protein